MSDRDDDSRDDERPSADGAPPSRDRGRERLRDRSGGKFYADGWSTAKHPPTYTYLWTSVLMLAIVVAVYATLTSLVGEAADVENQPAPVQIVFPKSR